MSDHAPLPEHYRKLYRCFLRFSIVMIFIALLAGIAIQESSRKAPISPMLPPGLHMEALLSATVVHGHVFLLGVLIPLAVVWMVHLSWVLQGREISPKAIRWGKALYIPGVVLSLVLLLYKGYYYLISVRTGHLDLMAVEQGAFFGMTALRQALYGLAHTTMSIGLGIFAVNVWRSLSGKCEAANP